MVKGYSLFRAAHWLFVFMILASVIIAPSALGQTQINVKLSEPCQVMDGTAGNIYGFVVGWHSNVMNLIKNDIDVTHMRLRSWIHWWEPNNDNSDPDSICWSAFNDSSLVHSDFLMLQQLTQAGIEPVLGIWEVPDWMVLNPNASEDRIIPPSMYPEFAELIVTYLLYAKQQYGAQINYIGIQNEPNIGIKNYFSPTELADVTEVILDALDKNGLSYVKIHVGDVNEPTDGIQYYDPSLKRSKIRNRAVAVSYHTWHYMTPSNLYKIWDYCRTWDIKNWATEVGTSPLDSTTFDWAMGSMENAHLSYKYADASLSFQWCLAGAETSINKTSGNPLSRVLRLETLPSAHPARLDPDSNRGRHVRPHDHGLLERFDE